MSLNIKKFLRIKYSIRVGVRERLSLILLPAVTAVIVLLFCILIVLTKGAVPIFEKEGIYFITTNAWIARESGEEFYGIAAAIYGTLITSIIAIALSLPAAISVAIVISEVSKGIMRKFLTTLLEFASGLPTVVFGLWAAYVLVPFLYEYVMLPLHERLGWFPLFSFFPRGGYSLLTAGVILAVMVLPYEALLLHVSFKNIPTTYVEAAYSLGLTKAEVIRLKLGMIKPSVVAALLLGFGRAVGETVAVSLVVGNTFYLGPSIIAPGYTISSLIANQFPNASLYNLMPSALYAAALVLLGICIPMNIVGAKIVSRRWLS